MIFIYFLFLPIIYPTIKIILALIVKKYGKVSYDGFNALGFAYNEKKDIFYSTKNAWQKNFGYSHSYDVMASIGAMIIDTEPIKFHYDNKNWLITFWKGQYGMTTGAEIGVYYTNDKIVNKNTLYMPVNEEDMLDMAFTLYRKKELITEVRAKHWWLAVFKLGMFSKPKHLVMDAEITFNNHEQLQAFLSSFKKLRHRKKNYYIIDNTFYFHYKKPKTRKVWTRFFLFETIMQYYNKRNVKLYNKYLSDTIDNDGINDSKNNQQILVNNFIPPILKNITKTKKLQKEVQSQNIVILQDDVFYKQGVKNEEVR